MISLFIPQKPRAFATGRGVDWWASLDAAWSVRRLVEPLLAAIFRFVQALDPQVFNGIIPKRDRLDSVEPV